MRRAGYVVRMKAKWNACRILVGKPEGKKRGGGLYVGGMITLRWFLQK
jgi:hypothetical protein